MKIKYLGTAAAEGMPALFCECEVCQEARKNKGKNVRSRSQVLVNNDLLIDYPPDSFYHFVNHDIDISKIHHLIISHAHEDHFYPLDFEYFLRGFSIPNKCLPFTIHGSIDIKEPLDFVLNNKERNQGLFYQELKPYIEYKVGNYFITPMVATHGTNHPYVYIVSDSKKEFFYCHDTGLLKKEVFDYLENSKHHFDLISLDCNVGDQDFAYSNHMNLDLCKETVKLLKQCGVVDDVTKIVLSHFSHNGGHVLFDEMCEVVKEDGFIVSYDGLEIEL